MLGGGPMDCGAIEQFGRDTLRALLAAAERDMRDVPAKAESCCGLWNCKDCRPDAHATDAPCEETAEEAGP